MQDLTPTRLRETLEKALAMYKDMGIMYWPDRAREVLERLES